MPAADLNLPPRLYAGGGPSSPDPRVLQALCTPIIGQFDPAFTAIMDEVMRLARAVLLTRNERCFAVSGLAAAGCEAVLNTLLEPGDTVAVLGDDSLPGTVAERLGARVVTSLDAGPCRLVVAPALEASTARRHDVRALADRCHARGALLLVEASLVLGGCELRVDEWSIDVCVAGTDYCLGGPSGMALVTYSEAVEAEFRRRPAPPPTSYLDLLQLQAYWSPERLNHHTAPTSLVYGVREALRLLLAEGLESAWRRHQRVFAALLAGLRALDLHLQAEVPIIILDVPDGVADEAARRQLGDRFGVHVQRVGERRWRIGLLGAQAQVEYALHTLGALEQVLGQPGRATAAALAAYEHPSPALAVRGT